jgi:hypothetical protein
MHNQVATRGGVFGGGGYGGGVFDGSLTGIGSLGADSGIEDRITDVAPVDPTTGMSAYPWMAYSPRTRDLQAQLATFLKNAGYQPNGVDGKLGPGTCGFLRFAQPKGFGWAPPDTCQSFGPAPKCIDATKCGETKDPGPVVITKVTCPEGMSLDPHTGLCFKVTAREKSGISSAWVVGGLIAAGVVAAGAVAFQNKKKHR